MRMPVRRRVVLAIVLTVLVLAGLVVARFAAEDREPATVVRVVDGDTVRVDRAGEPTTVRLLNVDAPETKDPNRPVACLGPEAAEFLTRLLPVGTRVELEYDGKRLDRYGRVLAGVRLGSELVNAEVARAGLGAPVVYDGQRKFLPAVEAAAREARRRQRGAYAADVSCALPGSTTR